MLRSTSNVRTLCALVVALGLAPAGEARAGSRERCWNRAPNPTVGHVLDPSVLVEMSLDELLNINVVTASKTVQAIEEAPSILSTFTRQEIDELGVDSLGELLRLVPGFYEVSSQLHQNFAIRGVHAASPAHFVLLIDGLPVRDFLFGASLLDTLDLAAVEQVEVIRGPGSALYGPNALVGVINIITRTDYECSSVRVRGGSDGSLRLTGTTGAKDASHSWLASGTAWGAKGTSWLVSGDEDVLMPQRGQNISDGIQVGENLSAPRGRTEVPVSRYGPSFSLLGVYRGLGPEQKEDWSVRFHASHTDRFLQRTYRQALVQPGEETQDPHIAEDQFAIDAARSWGSALDLGELHLRTSLLMFRHDMRSQRISEDFYAEALADDTDVIYRFSGQDLRVQSALEYQRSSPNLGPFSDVSAAAGVQAEYNLAFGYSMTRCYLGSSRTDAVSLYPNSPVPLDCLQLVMLNQGLEIDPFGVVTDTDTSHRGDGEELRVGGYLQLSGELPRQVGTVLIGGRADYHPVYGTTLSPRIAMVSSLPQGLYAKAQFATAFVYPAFAYRSGNSLSHYVGNPDIKPQFVRTFEALLGRKGNWSRLEISAYVNLIDDFITFDLTRNGRTGKYLFSNQGDLNVFGTELSGQLVLGHGKLTLNWNGSYTHALGGTDGGFLVDGKLAGASKFPELLSNFYAQSRPLKWLQLGLSAQYSSDINQELVPEVRFEDIVGTDGNTYSSRDPTSYPIGGITINALVGVDLPRGWRVRMGASNLFDQRRYRPGSVLVPQLAEGRVVWLGVSHQE